MMRPMRKRSRKDETGPERAPAKRKNPHAVALGRKGGLIGGRARAASMTPEERKASALKAIRARWDKHRA